MLPGSHTDGNWADAEDICKRANFRNHKNFLCAMYTQQVWRKLVRVSLRAPLACHVWEPWLSARILRTLYSLPIEIENCYSCPA